MRKFFVSAMLLGLLALAACGGSSTTDAGTPVQSATVKMDASSFLTTTVTLKVGGTLTFSSNPDGAQHILVLGQNATPQADANGPAELNNATGDSILAGKSITVTFSNPGTYHITCIIHPAMNLTVTVK